MWITDKPKLFIIFKCFNERLNLIITHPLISGINLPLLDRDDFNFNSMPQIPAQNLSQLNLTHPRKMSPRYPAS